MFLLGAEQHLTPGCNVFLIIYFFVLVFIYVFFIIFFRFCLQRVFIILHFNAFSSYKYHFLTGLQLRAIHIGLLQKYFKLIFIELNQIL